jgi:uncharacterized protein with HEPN domain
MPLSPLEYLRHILEEADFLLSESEHLDRDSFFHSETLKRAFVRNIEIIGEASKKVTPELRQKYPNIEWRSIAAMRDRLVHDYFGVDYEIVWDVVRHKIPHLRQEVLEMLRRENSA